MSERLAALKAAFPVGDMFSFLGRAMCITKVEVIAPDAQHEWRASGDYVTCAYVDDNGVINAYEFGNEIVLFLEAQLVAEKAKRANEQVAAMVEGASKR